MQSKTKYALTDAQIAAIFVRAGLGTVESSRALSDGWYNNVLEVCAAGTRYVLKVAPAPDVAVLSYEKDLMQQELEYIERLRTHTQVRVPRIVYQDFSRSVIPCDWFIMEYLEIPRLDKAALTRAQKAAATQAMAQLLAQFHTQKAVGFGYAQNGLEANWFLALHKMVRNMIADCARFGKKCPAGERLLRQVEHYKAVLEKVDGVLVNYDMHVLNLFIAPESGALTVIDLERCFWGDPLGDFVIQEATVPPQKKKFLRLYNQYAQTPLTIGRDEQIRYYLLVGYLGVMMFTERFSRYTPRNATYWADIAGGLFFCALAFRGLKRLW
ncbi:MAG: aminoglycoside phosphotransferase family protein [Oscillospiraceae bacterium]|nr:aminoglycoside phosphotransferase family protein [Oscillospiraceae bacterium]